MATRLSFPRLGLLLVLAFAVPGTTWAQAAQREPVALHPCVVTGVPRKAVSDLESVCATEASRTLDLVPSTGVRAFLDAEPRRSCAKARDRNACLGRLATATSARHAVLLTVSPSASAVRITGIVVSPDGKLRDTKRLSLPRVRTQPLRDTVRFAVAQLVPRLPVAAVSVGALTEPEPLPLAPAEPPPAAPAEPQDAPLAPPATASAAPSPAPSVAPVLPPEPGPTRTWKTPVGIVGVGAGVVAIAAAGFFAAKASSDRNDINAAYGQTGPSQEQVRGPLRVTYDSLKKNRTIALVSGGAGAVLLGVGAALWISDGPPERPGSARLLAGPNSVGVLVWMP